MPTALVGGAARRTAAQADGGRACTGKARKGTQRVLEKGYSKGVLKRVLEQGTHQGTQKAVLKRGPQKRGPQEGYAKGRLKKKKWT
jgi:hypothetical protein